MIGPPMATPNWLRFVSGRLSFVGCVKGFLAWNASFWKNSKALPWKSFVPDLVWIETTPAVA